MSDQPSLTITIGDLIGDNVKKMNEAEIGLASGKWRGFYGLTHQFLELNRASIIQG